MSIQDNGGPISYADHDVHHVRHRVVNRPNTGGDDVEVVAEEDFEITARGLDPDELAELRAMRVQVGCTARAGQAQDSRGTFRFEIGAGFNIGESDALHTQMPAGTLFDPDGDGTDEVASNVTDTDEVGQIYTYGDTFTMSYDDDTNGNGGIGGTSSVAETLNMADLFGSGPYVDAADDFSSVIKVLPDNIIEFFGVDVVYSLYYDVNEVEGGRSRFGR